MPRTLQRHRLHAVTFAAAAGAISLVAFAGVGSAAPEARPANTAEPAISGRAAIGSTLRATQGAWSGSPTSFSYQWVRCPSSGGKPDGSDCAAIGGATTSAYVVATADVGARLRVRVTASNADGSATAASNPTALVPAAAQRPRNTAEPTIAGAVRVGGTLTGSQGAWRNSPTSFAYQWVRCPSNGGRSDGSNCAAVAGATTQSYVVSTNDVGARLRIRVTAANAAGSTTVASNATGVVPAAQPATGCPSGAGAVRVDQVGMPARLEISGQQMSPSRVTRSTGAVTVRIRVTACQGRPVSGALVYVAAVPYNQFNVPTEQATDANGWATLTMSRMRGFPASRRQQLLALFSRARRPGDNPLGGISTRRLISFPVSLGR
jgi:hypothetical protein